VASGAKVVIIYNLQEWEEAVGLYCSKVDFSLALKISGVA